MWHRKRRQGAVRFGRNIKPWLTYRGRRDAGCCRTGSEYMNRVVGLCLIIPTSPTLSPCRRSSGRHIPRWRPNDRKRNPPLRRLLARPQTPPSLGSGGRPGSSSSIWYFSFRTTSPIRTKGRWIVSGRPSTTFGTVRGRSIRLPNPSSNTARTRTPSWSFARKITPYVSLTPTFIPPIVHISIREFVLGFTTAPGRVPKLPRRTYGSVKVISENLPPLKRIALMPGARVSGRSSSLGGKNKSGPMCRRMMMTQLPNRSMTRLVLALTSPSTSNSRLPGRFTAH